ncbi:hypothetical protein ACIQI7_23640 [Kitasatospora sp. NPDC092039]|uniref:hypothetical protein n=1 Tax=Kitasatospora sp. NPDC092039 TaxID=3364086 RepID=UPI00380CBA10
MKPHHYLEGASLTALGRGNRLIIRAIRPHTAKLKVTRQQIGGALALAAFLSPVLARPVARYAPTTITVLLVLWVVAAVAVGNTKAAAELAQADEAAHDKAAGKKPAENAAARKDGDSAETASPSEQDDAGVQADEPQDTPADADLYALVRYVAEMSDQGTAAHLSHVLEEGQARGFFEGWAVADLRAHLESLGVALIEGKKLTFNGRPRNRLAVALDALPETAPGAVPAVLRKAA